MGKGGGRNGAERDFTLDGEHMVQGVHDVLLNCALEACMVLLTNVTLKKRDHL